MKPNSNLLAFVQDALGKESRLSNCLGNIYVMVNDGAVIMAGSVTHSSLKNLARTIVSSVPGVSLLIDDLRVETTLPRRMGVQIDWAKGDMALNPGVLRPDDTNQDPA